MLEKSLEELSLTEGGKAAKKILRQNIVIKIAAVVIIIFVLKCWLWALNQENYVLYAAALLVEFLTIFAVRIAFSRWHLILQVECDPCKAEEAFGYAYKKREKRLWTKEKDRYYLLIARCILFEETFDRAFPLLLKVNAEQMRLNWQLIYFDCLRIYYGRMRAVDGDPMLFAQEWERLRLTFKSMLTSRKKKIRKTAQEELEIMEMADAMNQGDLTLYKKLSGQKEWKKGVKMVLVSRHWTDAKACYITKDLEGAKKHCSYVIANGNRLYYVRLAEQMLENCFTQKPDSSQSCSESM